MVQMNKSAVAEFFAPAWHFARHDVGVDVDCKHVEKGRS